MRGTWLAVILAANLVVPFSAEAQPTHKVWRLGVLYFGSPSVS